MLPIEQAFQSAAVFIHSYASFFLFTVALVALLTFWKNGWRRIMALSAVVFASLVLSILLKAALAAPRPCAMDGIAPVQSVQCPEDFSLPSVHTAVAFALAAASIGTGAFPFYFLYGIFVGASRIYLGVHSAADVGAGIALAVFCAIAVQSFGIGGSLFARNGGASLGHGGLHGSAKSELGRKAFQAALGICVLLSAAVFGIGATSLLVAYCLAAGLVLFHMKYLGAKVPLVDDVLQNLERPSAPPGFGALSFFCGMLICLTFIPDSALALSSVYFLAVSDGAAAILGSGGKTRLPYHPRKSLRGTLAFFASALPVYFIGGIPAIFAALLASLIESLPIGLDDNLTIPWAGVAAFALLVR